MSKRRGNREGSIYQDASRRWRAELWLGYRNGKPWRKKFSGRTREDVAKKLNKELADTHRSEAPERLTLSDFLDTWLRDVAKNRVRPSTYSGYKDKIETHLKPGLGRERLRTLHPAVLQRFFNERQRSGLSATSVRDIRSVLRNALRTAVTWKMISTNPVADTDPPRRRERAPTILDEAQSKRFLRHCAKHRLGDLFKLTLYTGMSRGEVTGLPWSAVDLDKGTLAIEQALQRVDGEDSGDGKKKKSRLEIVEVKAASRIRVLELSRPMVAALEDQRRRQLRERNTSKYWKESGLVFTTPIGTPLEPRNLGRELHALLKTAGLPQIRFHDLRHSAASLLLAEGVHPRAVQELLGHSDFRVTMNVYSHVIRRVKRDTAETMSRILSGPVRSNSGSSAREKPRMRAIPGGRK